MLEIKPIFNAMLRSKVGAIMLLIQIAITTAIVSNAAFIINDRIQYLQQDTGYPEHELLHFTILTFGQGVNLSQQLEQTETLLRNIPGVIDAAMVSDVPLSGGGSASSFGEQSAEENGKEVRSSYMFGDEHMINTLGINLVAGRNFNQDEVIISETLDELPNVAIASKTFMDELFPDGDGLGKTIFFGNIPLKIIGIGEKMMGPWLRDSRPDNAILIPFANAKGYQNMLVRAEAGQRDAIKRQLEDILLEEYEKRVIINLSGLDETKQDYNASDTLMLRMLLVLITVLVLVTALGIFGLTVFNINKRRRQIGTRRALGARKSAIVRYFLVENGIICLAGLTLGIIIAVYMGKILLEEYSLPALDNSYVMFTALLVFMISLISVVVPANRAANISPSVATRSI